MEYKYSEFTCKQISELSRLMHNDVHKLLLYKDKKVEEEIFKTDEDFFFYFENLLFRFAALNELLGEKIEMVQLIISLYTAYKEASKSKYDYRIYRKAILDSHGYIDRIFEGVV